MVRVERAREDRFVFRMLAAMLVFASVVIGADSCEGLVSAGDAGRLELSWGAAQEEDFDRYRVYQSAEYWGELEAGLTSTSVIMEMGEARWMLWPAEAERRTTFSLVAEPTSASWIADGLDVSTTYTWFVTARDSSGNESGPSNFAFGQAPDRVAPGAIESLRIVEAAVTSGTVTVRFDVRVGLFSTDGH